MWIIVIVFLLDVNIGYYYIKLDIINCADVICFALTRRWYRYMFLVFLVSIMQKSKKK